MVFWHIWSIFFLVPPRTYIRYLLYMFADLSIFQLQMLVPRLPSGGASSLAVLNRPLSSVAVLLPVLTDEDQRRIIRRGSFDMQYAAATATVGYYLFTLACASQKHCLNSRQRRHHVNV